MTTERAILTAVSERIAAQNLGVYRPTGVYAAGETGIVWATMPASPDRIIALTVYDNESSPNPADPNKLFRVQVRCRWPLAAGGPGALNDLMDALKNALTAHHTVWSGTRIDRCHRFSVVPMGEDSNRRTERADNYEIRTH